MPEHILSAVNNSKIEISSYNGRMVVEGTLPPSAAAVVGAAISGGATNPPNPSPALTSAAAVTTTAKPDQHVYNATGYLVEHEFDHSILAAFSDIQTVFLACISTLLPLIIALGIAFGVRHVWRKYRNGRNSSNGLPWYKGICSRENTSNSLCHRPNSGSIAIQPATRVLSAQDLVNGIDGPRYICETEVLEEVKVVTSSVPTEYTSQGNHTSKNANGNIITLTLKNNHLIVETEERAVTMEENKSRKYQDNDCSFVVEVQPGYQKKEVEGNKGSSDDMTSNTTDQQALVHREEIPDDRSCEFENTRLFGSTNTGLSQSDLSISSQDSVNPSYRYGNQVEYDAGHLGYPMYGGSYDADTLSWKIEMASRSGDSKWVEFDKSPDTEKTLLCDSKTSSMEKDMNDSLARLDKESNLDVSQGSGGSSIDHQDSTDASNSTDTVRSNPNLQVNGTTPNKLELMEQKALSNDFGKSNVDSHKPVITGALLKDDAQEDTFQEQQRKLGNGTLLTPEHQVSERSKLEQKPEASVFVPSHKRTSSIPPRLIEESLELERKKLDIYSQIKTSTKSILPGLSPKFELLQNEVSPIEEKES
ncbi:uncharacterized protein [Prorops nasuta]|uniref:uncharacterized protein n=1 Tax=Prorops nasuta TaxID=863751 RepID=UPI0034CDB8F7